MLESDVLLSIHDTDDDSGKYLVPGKFYDYMRSGRVVWNIGKEDGLAAEFLNEYELGVSCANRADSVEGMLRRLIGLKQKEGIEKLTIKASAFSGIKDALKFPSSTCFLITS